MSSLAGKVFKSSGLMVAAKFAQRIIGLVSMIILARLLDPVDFAIVAMSALVIHFCDSLTMTGSGPYLISKDELDDDDIHSAWTLELLLKAAVWGVLFLSVPAIVGFYDKPELEPVLYAATTILLINAARSPGLHLLKRELEYRTFSILTVVQKLVSFGVVMAIVWVKPTYWALVIGDIASALTLTIGSYLIHSYRPKLSIKKIKEQFAFSRWILLRGSVGFSKAQMDAFLVAKFFSAPELGVFHLTRNLSNMPNEIVAPAIHPIVAPLSRSRSNPTGFASQLSLSITAVLLLMVPLTTFMMVFPEPIVLFFFGDQWTEAYSILPPLSLVMLTFSLNEIFNQTCVAQRLVMQMFLYEVAGLILVFATLIAFKDSDLLTFSYARAATAIALMLGFSFYISMKTKLSLIHTVFLLIPIIGSSLIAAWVATRLNLNSIHIPLFELIVLTAVFFLIYYLSLVATYVLGYRKTYEASYIRNLHKSFIDKVAMKMGSGVKKIRTR